MRPAVWLRRSFYAFAALLFGYALLGMFLTGPVAVRVPRAGLEVDPSPARLRTTVERLCREFAPRSPDRVDNLDRTAAWIADELRGGGLEVELQDYVLEEGRFRNVVGLRPGSDPQAGAIVIGAHYDAVPGTPGADDNASGVAVLLELVRTQPEDRRFKKTHYFVAFSTEEPPFFGTDAMGSHVFAEKLRAEGVDVRLMISLDLVGYYSDEPGSQHFPSAILRLFYPGRGNFVAIIGDARSGRAIELAKRGMKKAASTLPIHSFRAPSAFGVVDLSDHRSFRRHGWPAVQVTDTAFMRYPYYHRAEDTPDKLDYERMAELVRSLHGVLWEGS
jgi:Zn-dependent M28 family amino/carboxypeptidase